jgi:Zn finger protein HypA/HybF involved in hydrogenase expression
MLVPIKCEKCGKRFGLSDVCMKKGAARCPSCKEPNYLPKGGPTIKVKVITTRPGVGTLKGRSCYCAKCMDVRFMPTGLPRCPQCGSKNIYPVDTNFVVSGALLARVKKDLDLSLVAVVTKGYSLGYHVLMSREDMKKLDEDEDTQLGAEG